MISLILNSNKNLCAVNNAKIFYGENKIANIHIKIPDTIGDIDTSECEFTLYIVRGGNYIRFNLEDFENNECSVPITNDITEFVGEHEMYIEIEADGRVIGVTNLVKLKVYPFSGLGEEIIRRDVYIARIEELEEHIASDDNDFEDIKNAISSTHVQIDVTTPTSEYGNLVRSIPRVILSDVSDIIEGTFTGTYEIPRGVTKICDYLFYHSNISGFIIPDTVTQLGMCCFSFCSEVTELTIPDTVTSLGANTFEYSNMLSSISLGSGLSSIPYRAFYYCNHLSSITIPSNIVSIGDQSFCGTALENVTISHGVQRLGSYSFAALSTLTTLTIPNTLTYTGVCPFNACSNLINVTIENGFNANNLDLSVSTRYSANTILSWINALADRTGQSAYTLRIGSVNINKLTSDQIAIATNKNWNLA